MFVIVSLTKYNLQTVKVNEDRALWFVLSQVYVRKRGTSLSADCY